MCDTRPVQQSRASKVEASPNLRLAAWWPWMLAAVVWLGALALVARRVRSQIDVWLITTDMGVYFQAAHRLRDGLSPYYDGELINGFANSYVYPPLLAILVLPFTFLPDALVRWGFLALGIAALWGSVALLGRGFGRTMPWGTIALISGLALSTSLVRDELVRGNVNLWITFLAAASLWYLHNGRGEPSGIIWGLAIALKPFLVIWLVYLAWRGRWHAAAWTAGAAAGLLLLSLAITLPVEGSVLRDWIDITRYYGEPARTTMSDNHSLRAMLERMWTDDGIRTVPWRDSSAIFTASFVALAGLVGGVSWWALRQRMADVRAEDAGARLLVDFGVVMGAGLLLQPLTQLAHLLVLAPAMFGVAYLLITPDRRVERAWVPAAAGWALLVLALASPVDRLLFGGEAFNPDTLGGWSNLWSGRIGLLLLLALALTAVSTHHSRTAVTQHDGA